MIQKCPLPCKCAMRNSSKPLKLLPRSVNDVSLHWPRIQTSSTNPVVVCRVHSDKKTKKSSSISAFNFLKSCCSSMLWDRLTGVSRSRFQSRQKIPQNECVMCVKRARTCVSVLSLWFRCISLIVVTEILCPWTFYRPTEMPWATFLFLAELIWLATEFNNKWLTS